MNTSWLNEGECSEGAAPTASLELSAGIDNDNNHRAGSLAGNDSASSSKRTNNGAGGGKKKPPIMQEQESLSGDDTMSLLTRSELLLLTGEPVSPSEVLKLWQAGQSATHPVTLSCTI